MNYLENGRVWQDTDGNPIQAHGGYILRSGDWFYWYGEDRGGRQYVSCYRSRDLLRWEFRRHVLTVDSPTEAVIPGADLTLSRDPSADYGERCELCINGDDPYRKVNIERPKVLYNARTNKYVLWAHFENGVNYACARAAVATCDTPDGDFVYHGSFRPLSHMSRDCTVFQEPDGTAYFISTANDNQDTHVYRLTDDYLQPAELTACLFPGATREAPVLFRHAGRYYMLNSGCTGWDPNPCCYSVSDAITGPWKPLQSCADETTYDTQPAFAIPLGGEDGTVLYMGDRWSGGEYFSSSYVLLPLQFFGEDELDFAYHDRFTLDVQAGKYISVEEERT